MKQIISGAWNNLVLPLLIAAILSTTGAFIKVLSNQATIVEKLENHLTLPAHRGTLEEMRRFTTDVSDVRKNVDGMERESKQIVKNIEQKVDLTYQLLLNEVTSLRKELEKINKQ